MADEMERRVKKKKKKKIIENPVNDLGESKGSCRK